MKDVEMEFDEVETPTLLNNPEYWTLKPGDSRTLVTKVTSSGTFKRSVFFLLEIIIEGNWG
jgi:uncharacterized cupredoxin-like copper-binding protein